MNSEINKIGIIGLGYVGLPLLVSFSKHFEVIGYDINKDRIDDLQKGIDRTLEITDPNLLLNQNIQYTYEQNNLETCDVYIITVPTPVDDYKVPDLSYLEEASKLVSKYLKKNNYVIYESTVYPGCTEEFCIPILEQYSGLKLNKDFYCGYSPERINPGDKKNTLATICKVTSGSTIDAAVIINNLYLKIIDAGTHMAPSIKVAEASKAIENAQRDINISFVNELVLIFDKMEIDIYDVLKAASTKWNFLYFKPGLVGGHCIGVDPYYLSYKSQGLGYNPQVILSGRRVNDFMGIFVANKLIKLLIQNGFTIKNSKILILGVTFKENCNDIRNSKVFDIYKELTSFGSNVHLYDPNVNQIDLSKQYGVTLEKNIDDQKYDGIILAVSHDIFANIDYLRLKSNDDSIIFDLKDFLPRDISNARI
jgi:UDP-N-acetyl-D-galactosamine dehydrogenase